jgi:hypothetical protein
MRRVFEFDVYSAAVILAASGAFALVLGSNGRSDAQDNLARQKVKPSW